MILQALVNYYEALARQEKIAVAGWNAAKVSYAITIDKEGKVHEIHSLLKTETKGKKIVMVPTNQNVPLHATRSGKMPPSYFLCDNARYLLGAWLETGNKAEDKKNKEKAEEYFKNAAEYHKKLLKDEQSVIAKAVCNFFDTWNFEEQKDKLKISIEELVKAPNLVFRYWNTGEQILNYEEIKAVWNNYYSSSSNEDVGQCLITGKQAPIARLHPLIKGVRGAQSSGAALVSFNAASFESYEKQQGMNAPVSEYAANAYGSALNYLLSEPKYNKIIGGDTVVYWAETGEEEYADLFSELIDSYDESNLIYTMESIAKGKYTDYSKWEINPETKFYILGLSPNAARLSVRFFYASEFGKLIQNIMKHYQRLEIQKPSYEKFEYPRVGDILYETVNRNATDKSAQPILIGNLFRAIIQNTRYPETIFSSIMIRIRSDHIINRNRAAMIKAYLIKNKTDLEEGVKGMELNESTQNVAYVLGRLFATLEEIQEKSARANNIELKTTIKDRYFNSASSTPQVVFPQLLRLANSHLKVLYRNKKEYDLQTAIKLEKQIGNLMNKLEISFPSHLTLEEQGIFILGYYHQTQKRYEKKER